MTDTTITPIIFSLDNSENTPSIPTNQASIFDVSEFNHSLNKANTPNNLPPLDNTETSTSTNHANHSLDRVVTMLKFLNPSNPLMNTEALSNHSLQNDFTPGQMLQVTVKAHEFLFQSELTTNIANRTSDGIQQLFKQQS